MLYIHPTHPVGVEAMTDFWLMPLVVLQSVGRGQVLYMGFEESWRWLFNKSDDKDYFARFWGQVVYRIGLSRELGEKQAQLMLDQPDPIKNRPATVYARLYDENFQPLKLPTIHTGHWDPVLAACNEMEIVLSVHIGSSSTFHRISMPLFLKLQKKKPISKHQRNINIH